MLECSELLCTSKAEVYCECETPAVVYCSAHGYNHFKETEHELQDFKPKNLGLHFSHTDLSIYTNQIPSISDVLNSPSFFQRCILKYLKEKQRYELEKIGIYQSLFKYLFDYKIPQFCFICDREVSYTKLHLSKCHNLTEKERQDYWIAYSSKYTEIGITMNDIV